MKQFHLVGGKEGILFIFLNLIHVIFYQLHFQRLHKFIFSNVFCGCICRSYLYYLNLCYILLKRIILGVGMILDFEIVL